MKALAERAESWLARHLARVPAQVVERLTARRPVVLDGQRLDPRTQHALFLLAAARRPPLDRLPVERARHEYARFPRIFEDRPVTLPRIVDATIPGPAGPLAIRVYDPVAGERPLPVLIYFHGGGGVIGSVDTHDGLCRSIARALGGLVVSVDYRLGPEHPFPAAPDDAWAAFREIQQQARALGGDPRRIAVGGDSMGGCLAAVVCQLERDAGRPGPCAQWLLYPATDRIDHTASRRLFAEGFLLTEDMLEWFMGHYLGAADRHDPRVSPLRHPRLDGLPPAVLVTAGFDPLRDEGRAYAEALRAAGGAVRYHCHEGLVHGFAQMTGAVEPARRAVLDAVGELRAIVDGIPGAGRDPCGGT